MKQEVALLAISGTQTLGLYVGLPALLFGLIALVAYLTSRPSGGPDGAFPRLRPGQTPVNNSGLHAGAPQPLPPADAAAPPPARELQPQDAIEDGTTDGGASAEAAHLLVLRGHREEDELAADQQPDPAAPQPSGAERQSGAGTRGGPPDEEERPPGHGTWPERRGGRKHHRHQ